MSVSEIPANKQHWQERVDLAAAFRWTARLNMHEVVANHFSLAVDDQGTRFLINPNQMRFARIRASDMIEVDLDDPTAQEGPDAPDPTVLRPCARAPARHMIMELWRQYAVPYPQVDWHVSNHSSSPSSESAVAGSSSSWKACNMPSLAASSTMSGLANVSELLSISSRNFR